MSLAWVGSTVRGGTTKRAVAIALVIMCSNVSNLSSGWVWARDRGDGFKRGWTIVVVSAVAAMLVTWGLRTWLRRENKRGARFVV